jgi:Ca2+-binding RTX toxin-like protein
MAFFFVRDAQGVDTYYVDEDNGVTTGARTQSPPNDVLIEELSWEDGSAVSGEDYSAEPQTLTFPGEVETSQPYTFTVIDDDLVEGDEFFYRVIRQDGVVVAREQFFIVDDDQSIATIEPPAATVLEEAGASVTFTIRLSHPVAESTRVAYATVDGSAHAGEDFVAQSGSVLFAAGQTSGTVTIPIAGDQLAEGAEDFEVRLTEFFTNDDESPIASEALLIGSDSRAVVTILDDNAELRLTTGPPGPQTEGHEGTRSFAYTLTRSGRISEALTVGWGVDFTAGTASSDDFSVSEGVLSFAPGQASATANVLVRGDLAPELAETFRLRLTPPGNVAVVGPPLTGTIVNDDLAEAGLVPLTQSLSQAEGDAGATAFTYVLLRTDDVSTAADVPYAVTSAGANAADFAGPISGAVRFEAGQAVAALTLTVAGDTTAEDHESFTLSVGGGRFTTFQLYGTIINDDPHDGPDQAASAGLRYVAGAADDDVQGGAGQDYLRGGEGDDLLRGGDSFDDLHGNAGNDTVLGGGGNDWVVGGKDADRLAGETGDDIVLGNLGADTCEGGAGADTIRGGQADDVLTGGADADWLSGDRGSDTLTGGAGGDTFNVFRGSGLDRVLDFHQAEGDRVRVEGGVGYSLVEEGGDLALDFGNGDRLVLVGVEPAALTSGWIFAG